MFSNKDLYQIRMKSIAVFHLEWQQSVTFIALVLTDCTMVQIDFHCMEHYYCECLNVLSTFFINPIRALMDSSVVWSGRMWVKNDFLLHWHSCCSEGHCSWVSLHWRLLQAIEKAPSGPPSKNQRPERMPHSGIHGETAKTDSEASASVSAWGWKPLNEKSGIYYAKIFNLSEKSFSKCLTHMMWFGHLDWHIQMHLPDCQLPYYPLVRMILNNYQSNASGGIIHIVPSHQSEGHIPLTLMRTASMPANMMPAWNTSVQMTALIPPWKGWINMNMEHWDIERLAQNMWGVNGSSLVYHCSVGCCYNGHDRNADHGWEPSGWERATNERIGGIQTLIQGNWCHRIHMGTCFESQGWGKHRWSNVQQLKVGKCHHHHHVNHIYHHCCHWHQGGQIVAE